MSERDVACLALRADWFTAVGRSDGVRLQWLTCDGAMAAMSVAVAAMSVAMAAMSVAVAARTAPGTGARGNGRDEESDLSYRSAASNKSITSIAGITIITGVAGITSIPCISMAPRPVSAMRPPDNMLLQLLLQLLQLPLALLAAGCWLAATCRRWRLVLRSKTTCAK